MYKSKIFGFSAHSKYSIVVRFIMAAKKEVDVCFVCLEELKLEKALTVLSCGHRLHYKCQFFCSVAKNDGKMLCGMCRAPIMNEEEG